MTNKIKFHNGKIAQVESGKDKTGFLLRDVINGKYFFRIYSPKDKQQFEDYKLVHFDLEITIKGEAGLYKLENGNQILDHSPETLGYENEAF